MPSTLTQPPQHLSPCPQALQPPLSPPLTNVNAHQLNLNPSPVSPPTKTAITIVPTNVRVDTIVTPPVPKNVSSASLRPHTSSTFPSLPSPTHLLIIPLEHTPTLASISVVEDRARTYKEMHRYRHALHNFLISRCGSKMGAVTWEVSRAHVRHTHWQFLPVAADQVKKGLVEAAFKVEAENEKYPTFFRAKDVGDGMGEKGEDFFR
ncbi:MAG: hypothetical protein Q9183_008092, partial [Haloplaca sp. 2 TL-2023]